MKKGLGWLFLVFGIIWGVRLVGRYRGWGAEGTALTVLLTRLLFPVLLGIVGLYLAGVIRTGDGDE